MVGTELEHRRANHFGLGIGAGPLVPGLADLVADPPGHDLVDSLRNLLADIARHIATLLGGDCLALRANFLLLDSAIAFGNLHADVVVDDAALVEGQDFVDVGDRCSAVLVAGLSTLFVVERVATVELLAGTNCSSHGHASRLHPESKKIV